jgi:type IV pilus assembly protein PilB
MARSSGDELPGDVRALTAAPDSAWAAELPRGVPIVRLADGLIAAAVRDRASDIHVEPFESVVRIRCRVDGQLRTILTIPPEHREALVSRLKVLAHLDIAERRLPQDGRFTTTIHDDGPRRAVDVRVSVLPTLFGEKVVLRLLDPIGQNLDMTELGFAAVDLDRFERSIRRPWGMVLVTGPTGSGKTSTLYAALTRLNHPAINIVTVEDPVEFNLHGINQVQVRDQIGLTFAGVLRALLRQDPDVILVGEIRDNETAAIAIKAALTGHLVLSTLHTNDAPTSITRLVDMGIEPFLVANSINLVCAQRLVRRSCTACRQIAERDARRPCPTCQGTGFRGRTGLFEVMEMSEPLRDLVSARASTADIRRAALAQGMTSLREAGLARARAGTTTIDEVLRETM